MQLTEPWNVQLSVSSQAERGRCEIFEGRRFRICSACVTPWFHEPIQMRYPATGSLYGALGYEALDG